jgi:hypothetical protein
MCRDKIIGGMLVVLIAPLASPALADDGMEAHGGFKLRGNLALEVSSRSDDGAVDLNERAGGYGTRLDIHNSPDTAIVKAVGDLPLPELLSWRGNWPLFGTVGYYRSERTVRLSF